MTCVSVAIDDDDQAHVDYLPVLGIVVRGLPTGPSFSALVHDPGGYDLCEVCDLDGANVASDLAVCPWPIEEDTERLGRLVENLTVEARERLAALHAPLLQGRPRRSSRLAS
jgi:hypothetical protein